LCRVLATVKYALEKRRPLIGGKGFGYVGVFILIGEFLKGFFSFANEALSGCVV
jgi:hypothetical protein